MIVAAIQDRRLQDLVRRAALPEEDVFFEAPLIFDALERGFPRLAVRALDDPHELTPSIQRAASRIPVLTLTRAGGRNWRNDPTVAELVISDVDDHSERLRRLIATTAGEPLWSERLLRDLGRVAGIALPPALRGMGRRTLEFPARYADLREMASLADLSRDALKARFRRRGLPSPFAYLRWFRLMAVAHVLSDRSVTTVEAAYRLGFASSGNLCRSIRATAGLSTRTLREPDSRNRLLVWFVRELMTSDAVSAWRELESLFLERAA